RPPALAGRGQQRVLPRPQDRPPYRRGRDHRLLPGRHVGNCSPREAGMRIVVLTGAGVSAESGVPTFRDADGLWEGHPVEEVATPTAFRRDPRLVWQFYNARRANLARIEPNPGHHALVRLEERFGPEKFTLVT